MHKYSRNKTSEHFPIHKWKSCAFRDKLIIEKREVIFMDDNVYWEFLEKLRESGATNMYGAVPNLIFEFGISYEKATEILLDWMENHKEIKESKR